MGVSRYHKPGTQRNRRWWTKTKGVQPEVRWDNPAKAYYHMPVGWRAQATWPTQDLVKQVKRTVATTSESSQLPLSSSPGCKCSEVQPNDKRRSTKRGVRSEAQLVSGLSEEIQGWIWARWASSRMRKRGRNPDSKVSSGLCARRQQGIQWTLREGQRRPYWWDSSSLLQTWIG